MRLVVVPLHRVHSSPAVLFKSWSAKAKALKCADILQLQLQTDQIALLTIPSSCLPVESCLCGGAAASGYRSLLYAVKKESLLWGHIEMHMFMAAQYSSIWTWSKADQEIKCAWNRCAYIYFYLCIPLYASNQNRTHPTETCGNRIWPLGVRWTWTYTRT